MFYQPLDGLVNMLHILFNILVVARSEMADAALVRFNHYRVCP